MKLPRVIDIQRKERSMRKEVVRKRVKMFIVLMVLTIGLIALLYVPSTRSYKNVKTLYNYREHIWNQVELLREVEEKEGTNGVRYYINGKVEAANALGGDSSLKE